MNDILHDQTTRISREIEARMGELIELRRHIHANPELSHKEFKTTALLRERLRHLGLDVRVRSEGTGLIADIVPPGFDPSIHPTVGIRADLDALPIEELNDVDYRSQNPGVMHACGHDVHTTCAYGAGLALHAFDSPLPGRVRLIFQHAEEVAPSGAPQMISFGALDGVDALIGMHCDPQIEVGTVGLRTGALTASFDRFIFEVRGTSGHGARPHNCVDPIYAGVQLANALYNAPGRRMDARDPSVISIGEFHGGAAPNAIPDVARLSGTVRTLSLEQRAKVRPMLQEIAAGVAMMTGTEIDLDLYEGSPPIINHPAVVEHLTRATREILGAPAVYEIPLPSMGSEDFSNFLARVPGAMFRLGTQPPGRDVHLLHTPRFNIDERAIAHGSRILARAAVGLLHELSEDRAALG